MTGPTLFSFCADVETPVSLFHKLRSYQPLTFLLESTDGDNRLARYSFIGIAPIKSVRFAQGTATIFNFLNDTQTQKSFSNPLSVLENEHADLKARCIQDGHKPDFPFVGGWVGYMGYGATQYFDQIPQQTENPLAVPEGYYGLYDTILIMDHLTRRITFLSYREAEQAYALWQAVQQQQAQGLNPTPLFLPSQDQQDDVFAGVTGPFTQETFCKRVEDVKALIDAGEIFQLVLSQRFSQPITVEAFDIYRTLQMVNPSPYSYFLQFPDFVYLGSSPETYVQCNNNTVVLRALAGTRPRGDSPEADAQLARDLRNDEKELAEHRMLVDLGRNDLGRVCEVGSIKVGELARLTRYSHVMHLATELSGTLRPDKTVYEVFKSCFPRGTVSGAPKIRAMHLLAKLEPEQRGIYAGVVGYFDHFGNMDGAIAIRSALVKNQMAHVNAGAGIVYDSQPEAEYQETRNKAKSMLTAIRLAQRMGVK